MKVSRLLVLALLGAAAASAFAQNVVTNNLNPKDTNGITGFATTGAMMDRMTIRVAYSDGSSDSAVWGVTGTNAGGASTANWSLSLDGDSYSAPWTFSTSQGLNSSVRFIYLDGAPGRTVFDMVYGSTLTPGSELGFPFRILSGIADFDAVTATYSSPLGLNGNAPMGDLYVTLNIDLGTQALWGGHVFEFRADTDNATTAIVTGGPVPEPFTMALVGGALVAALKRRRSRR